MFDVAEQMAVDGILNGILMDQFIIERLHLLITEHAERCDNPNARFERAVLSGVFHSQAQNARRLRKDRSLLDETPMLLRGYPDARFGDNIELHGMRISVSDFVYHGEELGEVVACAEAWRTLRCRHSQQSGSWKYHRWHFVRPGQDLKSVNSSGM